MPRTEHHWVFAYGSNMHMPDLQRWHREKQRSAPVIRTVVPAILEGYALVWNYYSHVRGGGAANVEPSPGQAVPGLLLEVNEATFASLDMKEGRPTIYERSQLPLRCRDGRTQLGWVYEVIPARRSPHFIPPHRTYLSLLVEAAKAQHFPADYVRWLETLPTAPTP